MCEAVFCGILHKIMRFEVETFLLFIAFHAFYLPCCAKIIILLTISEMVALLRREREYLHTNCMLLFIYINTCVKYFDEIGPCLTHDPLFQFVFYCVLCIVKCLRYHRMCCIYHKVICVIRSNMCDR